MEGRLLRVISGEGRGENVADVVDFEMAIH